MHTVIKDFEKYIYSATVHLENDGYIGIPADVKVFYDKSKGKIISGANGTPIIIYVINTAVKRVGTATDCEIISSMLERGYAVLVLDYKNNVLAISPALDYSVQRIRNRIINQKKDDELFIFEEEEYLETFIVPAGYDVELSRPYWAFDKHGADGILEKIVEIWNNDFKGTNPEKLIKWVDENGKRKKCVSAIDGSLPFWCDENGNECENGSYINIKYTLAENIEDCVKPDGSPIDLNLYLHIIYPKRPTAVVPVMCLSSSAEHLANGSSTADRPHLNGFLFRGYAGVMFDYGYTPMARVDHYDYFDGFPKKGYVTGDNATYSLSFYNDKRIFTAAMRYIRYLALSDNRFLFDKDAIGVYGNSKGSWMTFLGEENPERLSSKRILAGHHDETRYEAGRVKTIGKIRGGEEQPWLAYNGKTISGVANLIYSSCGGIDDAITANHCPMFISCNRTDPSCYSTSNAMLAACRMHNVPAMFVDVDLPHTIAYGKDLTYGFDAYLAFYDFIGYYLKHDAVKVLGIKANTEALPYSIKVRFSGAVSYREIEKVTILAENGEVLRGKWSGAYGGVEWTFIPESLGCSKKYTLRIPLGFVGKNGKEIEGAFSYSFVSAKTTRELLVINPSNENSVSFSIPENGNTGRSFIEFDVLNDGYNRLSLRDASGTEHGFVNTHGAGKYVINITDARIDASMELLLTASREIKENVVFKSHFDESMNGFSIGKRANASLAPSPDGVPSIMISDFETVKDHHSEEFYIYPDAVLTCNAIAGKFAIIEADMGRTFDISLKIYDTVSRCVKIGMSHATSMEKSIADSRRQIFNVVTKANEWVDVSLEYEVYEFMYSDFEPQIKSMVISCYGLGNESAPIYFAEVKSVERVTPIKLGNVCFVNEKEPKDYLPEGKTTIICKKSPWQK